MVAMNVMVLISTFINEGRLKPNYLKWAIRYAMTVPAARHGDLEPFLQIAGMPPGS